MKKNINYSSITMLLLVVAVVVMAVGFANFSNNLNIKGTTTVSGASWNVGFVSDSYEESSGSLSVAEGDRSISNLSMTYKVTLSKPGDFYEFTVDVKNSGTFDASLTGITMTSLTEAQSKYLTYKVYYNGTEYTATNSNISNVVLNCTDTETTDNVAKVKVRVEYIQPASADDLPSTAQEIELQATLSYLQKA